MTSPIRALLLCWGLITKAEKDVLYTLLRQKFRLIWAFIEILYTVN